MDEKLNSELSSFLEEEVITGVSDVDYRPDGDIYIYFEDTIYTVPLRLLCGFADKHDLSYFISTNSKGLYFIMYGS